MNPQIERIKLMEQHLDAVCGAVAAMTEALGRLEAARVSADELGAYYGSELWRQDLADDEAGRLPRDLRRGVLSEDGVWNALVDWRQLNGMFLTDKANDITIS